jgi:hypothetical protein
MTNWEYFKLCFLALVFAIRNPMTVIPDWQRDGRDDD